MPAKSEANIPDNYFGIEFPPYQYVEFPKWITNAEGKQVIVHSAEEERIATASRMGASYQQMSKEPPKHVSGLMASTDASEYDHTPITMQDQSPDPRFEERKNLVQEAEKMGVKIDKRWGISRLKKALGLEL